VQRHFDPSPYVLKPGKYLLPRKQHLKATLRCVQLPGEEKGWARYAAAELLQPVSHDLVRVVEGGVGLRVVHEVEIVGIIVDQ
jgi:hypothetical protein